MFGRMEGWVITLVPWAEIWSVPCVKAVIPWIDDQSVPYLKDQASLAGVRCDVAVRVVTC